MERLKIKLVPEWQKIGTLADGRGVPKVSLISSFSGKYKARAEVLQLLHSALGFEKEEQLQAAQDAVQAGLFLCLAQPGLPDALEMAGFAELAKYARQVQRG